MSDETREMREGETPETDDAIVEEAVTDPDEDAASETGSVTEPEPDPEVLLARERDEFKDKWLRAVAETDNVRKRARRETVDARRFATADLMREMLEVLDNFERAAASADDDADGGDDALRSGLELIHNRFREILAARGLEPVPAEPGQDFDPNIHEAVMRAESEDVPSGAIVEVAQIGYRLDDLVLRPARVVVAQ